MGYEEASNVIQEYMDTYILPGGIEIDEALSIALLALKRCIYMDELHDRKKEKGTEK